MLIAAVMLMMMIARQAGSKGLKRPSVVNRGGAARAMGIEGIPINREDTAL